MNDSDSDSEVYSVNTVSSASVNSVVNITLTIWPFLQESPANTLEEPLVANGTSYVPYEERPETYIVPALFALIFLIGSTGNLALIIIFLREKLYQSPSYLYILNLAFGDLIVILGTVPFAATIYTFESWPYGEFVCKASEFIRDVSIAVTVFTLTVMSYDRYKATFATHVRLTKHNSTNDTYYYCPYICTLVAIWTVSILFFGLPALRFTFVWHVNLSSNSSIDVCYPFPQSLGPLYPKAVVLTKFTFLYLIPLSIITVCYICVSRQLKRNSAHLKLSFCVNNNNGLTIAQPSAVRSNRRQRFRSKLVILFVFIFMVCFFPQHFFMLWFYFDSNSHQNYNQFWHIWRILAFVLSFLSSCLNPIILYLTSSNFRSHFKNHILRCKVPQVKNVRIGQESGHLSKFDSSGEHVIILHNLS